MKCIESDLKTWFSQNIYKTSSIKLLLGDTADGSPVVFLQAVWVICGILHDYLKQNAPPLKIQSVCVFRPPRLREKANLAVTVASEEDEVVAHASFFDHPLGGLVDQTQWEPFVQKHFGADKCTVCVAHRVLTFRPCNILQCRYLKLLLKGDSSLVLFLLQTLNTLFLHLFVARPEFASAGVKEILRWEWWKSNSKPFTLHISTDDVMASKW